MIKQVKNIVKGEFKRSNAKVFLLFLFFSIILWLLMQFSRTYTQIVEIPVRYENPPLDKMVDKNADKIRIELEQSGFQYTWLSVFRPEVVVNLNELPVQDTLLVFNVLENRSLISKSLSQELAHANFIDSELKIPFETKSIKIVPIISRVNVQFSPGYFSEEEPHIDPDSVQVSGPDSVLDTLQAIYTQDVRLKRVRDSINTMIPLENPGHKVALYEKETGFKWKVEKFTERKMDIPISIINRPADVDINLFPSSVQATFMISVKKFDLIKAIDFNIVVDYNELSETNEFLIPKIVNKPKAVKNISISPKRIQYVIKK